MERRYASACATGNGALSGGPTVNQYELKLAILMAAILIAIVSTLIILAVK
jgi:hypothetical protein